MLICEFFVPHGFAEPGSEVLGSAPFLSEHNEFSKADGLQSLDFFSDNFQL